MATCPILHRYTALPLEPRKPGSCFLDGRYSRAHEWAFDGGARRSGLRFAASGAAAVFRSGRGRSGRGAGGGAGELPHAIFSRLRQARRLRRRYLRRRRGGPDERRRGRARLRWRRSFCTATLSLPATSANRRRQRRAASHRRARGLLHRQFDQERGADPSRKASRRRDAQELGGLPRSQSRSAVRRGAPEPRSATAASNARQRRAEYGRADYKRDGRNDDRRGQAIERNDHGGHPRRSSDDDEKVAQRGARGVLAGIGVAAAKKPTPMIAAKATEPSTSQREGGQAHHDQICGERRRPPPG